MYLCCIFSYRYYRRCVELFNVQCWVITAKASLIKNSVVQMNDSLKHPRGELKVKVKVRVKPHVRLRAYSVGETHNYASCSLALYLFVLHLLLWILKEVHCAVSRCTPTREPKNGVSRLARPYGETTWRSRCSPTCNTELTGDCKES